MRLSQLNRLVSCPFDMNTDIVIDVAFVFNIGIVSNHLDGRINDLISQTSNDEIVNVHQ